MAIERKLIPASLTSGLDTDTDPKLGPKGLTRVEDGVYRRRGTISKRYATEEIASSINEEFITKYNGEPVLWGSSGQIKLYDGGAFDLMDYIALAEADVDVFYSKAGVTTTQLEIARSIESSDGQVLLSVYASDEDATGSGWYARTYDRETRQIMDYVDLDTISGGVARCVATTDTLNIITVDSDGYLKYHSVDDETGEISAATKIADMAGASGYVEPANGFYDELDVAVMNETDGLIAVTYIIDDGYGNYEPYYLCIDAITPERGGCVSADSTMKYCQKVAVFCQNETSEYATVAWYNEATGNHDGYAITLNTAGSVINARNRFWHETDNDVVMINLAGAKNDAETGGIIVWTTDDQAQVSPNWDYRIMYDKYAIEAGNLGFTGNETLVYGAKLYSKPWVVPDGTYDMCIIPDNGHTNLTISSQWSYIVINDSTKLRAKFLLNQANNTNFVVNAQILGSDPSQVFFGCLKSEAIFNNQAESVGQAKIIVTNEMTNVDAQEAENLLIFPGSVSHEFDGQAACEQGFLVYPHDFNITFNGAGNLDEDKSYGYIVVYEYYDRNGNRHQSSPSPAETVTTSSGNTKTIITFPTLQLTNKDDTAIAIYRTIGDGSVYYRVNKVLNNKSERALSFTDNVADEDIEDNEVLYTDGGILENIQPPQFRVHCLYQNRHFCVDSERDNVLIRYSKPIDQGFGIEHNDVLFLECNPAGGEITALVEYLDRLLIFKNDRIYMTSGNGLDNAGLGNNYYNPSLLSNTIGCENQKLILRLPQGLCFAATDGNFYMINAKLELAPFGDAVSLYGTDYDCGTILPTRNEAVWLKTDGYGLVYNWNYGLWSIWTNHEASDCIGYDDQIMFKEQDTGYIRSQLNAYKDPEVDTEDGYSYLKLETGWYSFAGIAGFSRLKRIYILGQNISGHKLRVKVGYNFDLYWEDDNVFDTTSVFPEFEISAYYTGVHGNDSSYLDGMYMIEVPTSRQKITSVRIHISDELSDTVGEYGAAYELTGLVFDVGLKKGGFKLGDSNIA